MAIVGKFNWRVWGTGTIPLMRLEVIIASSVL
jgi:hypothetical protein